MTKLPAILTAITITALTLSGCIYGDKAASWVITATNGCSHDISAKLSSGLFDEGDFNLDAHRQRGTSFTLLPPGHTIAYSTMDGQPELATLIVASDNDALFFELGEDAGSSNDYTITGDDCLPALTTNVSEDDSDNAL